MTLYDKLSKLKSRDGRLTPHRRIYCELMFAADMSTARGGEYDALIHNAADHLLEQLAKNGALTRADVSAAEGMLLSLSAEAKQYKAHCIGHAHIDMNWMWGYNETACVTVDTFRTVLRLMEKYPSFTFSQSQASTYKIIEENAPEMLDEIKRRVHEGRWELSASTWVESDKNMPSGEALCRHILYTKRYLARLFDIDPSSLELDFEPDTFGHAETVPEICARGGIKYYYHCRGREGAPCAYVWRSRSGAELLVYNEPHWYNTEIAPELFCDYPQLCKPLGTREFAVVYGVGDHGGGPTRRDLEGLIEIGSWPLMPRIEFSTYSRFFKALEAVRDQLPVVTGELNCTFTGCYTSQSRIKMANSFGQARMKDAEFLCALSRTCANDIDRTQPLDRAWEGILFNQFHDILPGSGTIETREYAMGRFQNAMAAIQTASSCAMNSLTRAIKISLPQEDACGEASAEGAGAGFAVGEKGRYAMPAAGRHAGKTRAFQLFNSNGAPYKGTCEITVWDWPFDEARARFTDAAGKSVRSALTDKGERYWGHRYKTFVIEAEVPALGYATYYLTEEEQADNLLRGWPDGRVDAFGDQDIVLENECLKATFWADNMALVSLIDKASGEEMLLLPAAFSLISENTKRGMTSWRVGERMHKQDVHGNCAVRVTDVSTGGLRQSVSYSLDFGSGSKLKVNISLGSGESQLVFDVSCDFHEIGDAQCTPQLLFEVPHTGEAALYRYDIPYGTIDRAPVAHDVPAQSFICALTQQKTKAALALMADCKYGYRGYEDTMSVTLLRASSDPDPYPEFGIHRFRLALVVSDPSPEALIAQSEYLRHKPIVCAAALDKDASLPTTGSLLRLSGALLGAVRPREDGSLMLRLYSLSDEPQAYEITLPFALKSACRASIDESPLAELAPEGQKLRATIGARSVETLLLFPA